MHAACGRVAFDSVPTDSSLIDSSVIDLSLGAGPFDAPLPLDGINSGLDDRDGGDGDLFFATR